MQILAIFVLFCVVAVLVYVARYSGRVRASQERLIQAPIAEVFACLAAPERMQSWNPWLENGDEVQCSPLALHWSGPRGKGHLRTGRVDAPHHLLQTLQLTHPFQTSAKLSWTLQENQGHTLVKVSLKGRVGFAQRYFSKAASGMFALDLRHGLEQFATLCAPSMPPQYTIESLGCAEVRPLRFASSTYAGPLDGLQDALSAGLVEVLKSLKVAGLDASGPAVAVYVKTNFRLKTTVCHYGWSVAGEAPLPADLVCREQAVVDASIVRFTGDPSAMDIAWYKCMAQAERLGRKPDQTVPAFEFIAPGAGLDAKSASRLLHLPLLKTSA